MDMRNLNVFRRLDELETANLHLQVLLQGARRDIDSLKKITKEQTQWLTSLQSTGAPEVKAKPKPKTKKLTKVQAEAVRAVKAAYARKYYAKKRAAREAAAKVAA